MNPWRSLGGLPREVWILFTATVVNRAGTMVLPFLVLYLTEGLGLSAGKAGLALVVYGAGSILMAPLAGRLCDRIGTLLVIRSSLLASGSLLLVFPFVRRPILFLALTFIWSLASEALKPATLAILSEVVPAGARKTAFAVSRLAVNLGMSVGPAAGGFLAVVSFPALFVVDGATSILAGLILLLVPWRASAGTGAAADPAQPAGERRVRSQRRDVAVAPAAEAGRILPAAPAQGRPRGRSALADPRLLYFLAAMIPAELVFFQHLAALPLFVVRDLGLRESAYGLLITVNTLLIILVEVPLNAALAAWPHRRALSLGAMLVGVGFGALAFARGFVEAAGAVVVWTFGEMVLVPASSAYVADIAPAARRGEYLGLYTMSYSVAFAVAPWLGTEALERFGAGALWTGALACGCLSAAMMTGPGIHPGSAGRVPEAAGELAASTPAPVTPVSLDGERH